MVRGDRGVAAGRGASSSWFQGGRGWGLDAWAYWSVDQVHPYSQTVGSYGAFLYGPPLAQVFGVLGHLPWPVFLVGWTGLLIATYAWITRRYALVLLGLFPAAILELINGNIHLLLAAAIALGFRYPWTWSFVLLTKVTPGIGLVWFAVRREWRALAIALGATAAIAAVSFVLAPWMWREWVELLIAEVGQARGAQGHPHPAHPPAARSPCSSWSGAPAPTGPGPCPSRRSWPSPRCGGTAA